MGLAGRRSWRWSWLTGGRGVAFRPIILALAEGRGMGRAGGGYHGLYVLCDGLPVLIANCSSSSLEVVDIVQRKKEIDNDTLAMRTGFIKTDLRRNGRYKYVQATYIDFGFPTAPKNKHVCEWFRGYIWFGFEMRN